MYQDKHIIKLHHSTEKLAKRKSCWYGFLYGIGLGLGASLGVAVVLGVIIYILQELQYLPYFDKAQINNIIDTLKNSSPILK